MQPPAQSRVSHEIRPVYSGLSRSHWVLKNSKDRKYTTSLGPCFTASLSSWGKKSFPYIHSYLKLCPLSLILLPHTAVKSLALSPWCFLIGTELLGLPKATSFQVEQAWLPQPSTTGQVLQLPDILGALC